MTQQSLDIIPDELLKTKLLRNGFWMYFFAFIAAPTGYIVKLIIARSLSVEEIGIFYSVLGLVSLLIPYHDLGLSEALQYYIPRYLINKDYDKTKSIAIYTLLAQLISWLAIGVVLFMASWWLASHYFHNIIAWQLLQYFSLYFVLYSVSKALESFFLATQHIKRSQWLWALRMRTIVVFVILAICTDNLTLQNFTIIWLIWVIVKIIVGAIGFNKLFGNILRSAKTLRSKQLFSQQWKYGIWVMFGAWAGTLLGEVNQQFALFLWAWAAAQWAYYLSFHTIATTITWPLIAYLFPLLNELYTRNHETKIRHLHRLLFLWVIAFGIIGWVLGYFLSEPVAVLLFGEWFREAWVLFTHYAPFVFTIPLYGILFQDIASRGLVKQRVWVLAIALLVNAWASYYFVTQTSLWLTWLVYAQLLGSFTLIVWGWRWRKRTPKKKQKNLPE